MEAALIAALVVSWVFVWILLFLLFVLIREQGELRLYHEELDQRLEVSATHAGAEHAARPKMIPEQTGLPVGADAPDFALPDLEGNVHRRQEYLGQAVRDRLLRHGLRLLPRDVPAAGRARRGLSARAGHARRAGREQAACGRPRLEAPRPDRAGGRVGRDDGVPGDGTPSGYLVDEEGRIASPVALGGDAVLGLWTTSPAKASENGHRDPTGVQHWPRWRDPDGRGHGGQRARQPQPPSRPVTLPRATSSATA